MIEGDLKPHWAKAMQGCHERNKEEVDFILGKMPGDEMLRLELAAYRLYLLCNQRRNRYTPRVHPFDQVAV